MNVNRTFIMDVWKTPASGSLFNGINFQSCFGAKKKKMLCLVQDKNMESRPSGEKARWCLSETWLKMCFTPKQDTLPAQSVGTAGQASQQRPARQGREEGASQGWQAAGQGGEVRFGSGPSDLFRDSLSATILIFCPPSPRKTLLSHFELLSSCTCFL